MNEQTSLLNATREVECDSDKSGRKKSTASNALQEKCVDRVRAKQRHSESDAIVFEDRCMPMQKVCFGLGHVYNDLCAAVWFTYMLFYLQIVLQMDSSTAGVLIMIGQVADALATPSAGWAIDRISSPRVWHLIGTILVACGFTLMFSYAPAAPSPEVSAWHPWLYYALLITTFQIGWAIVQISHLSIITMISKDKQQTSALTSIRYTASVCCNVFVYLITWAILKSDKNGDEMEELGRRDFSKFKEMIAIITSVGCICSLIFYCGMRTPPTYETHPRHAEVIEDAAHANAMANANGGRGGMAHHSEECADKALSSRKSVGKCDTSALIAPETRHAAKSFLKSIVTYQVSIMYMSSRLYTILNLIYIPLYLEERVDNIAMPNEGNSAAMRGAIATVPLMCFVSSFLTSLAINNRPVALNDKIVFALGGAVSLIGCIWIAVGLKDGITADIYALATIIGVGGSATMITSLCMTAHFVNANGLKSGAVYSTVTFTDKLVSGAVVFLIQHLECGRREQCPNYYQNVLAYATGLSAILGLLSLGSLQCFNPTF